MRHTPLFKNYLPTTELTQQRYAWVYVEIRSKLSKLQTMTSPHLSIEILTINIWLLEETNLMLFRRYQKDNFFTDHMKAAECIPTKLKAKCRVPWEALVVRAINLTAIATKVYNALLLNRIQSEIKKILRKNQNSFWRNHFTTSQILTICWIIQVQEKNLKATLLFIHFFKTQKKDGPSTTSIWSAQINCYWFNDALQKHQSNGFLTWWRKWFFQHSRWSLAKRYISTIFVYTLSRLCTSNVHESNKRKWFHIKKA